MTYLGFPILSLIFITILLVLYYSKKRIKLYENEIVLKMMKLNVLGLVLELSCYIVMALLRIQETFIGMFILKSYIAYIPIFNLLLTGYIFVLTNKERTNPEYDLKKYYYKILLYFLPLTLIVVLITYLAPLEYYSEYPKFYTYGLSTTALFYSFSILLPIWLFRCFSTINKNDSSLNGRIYMILIGIILVGSAGGLIQFVDRSILILTSAHTIMLILIYLTIENPDVKMIAQLELAINTAEKANNAKSDFLSSMSHEIRTPLNAIVTMSHLMMEQKEQLPEEAQQYIKVILNSSDTVLDIVGNVLDINKIDTHNMDLVEKPYNFVEEIKNMAEATSTRIGEKKIKFKMKFAKDIPYELIGDKVRVKQIVNNLLTNSIKYTDKGSINLNVECINKKNNCNLIISVTDTGKGIKKENIEKLFTRFERLDAPMNSTVEGTGLGLAITKSLVDMMGGKINVSSIHGEGSTFTVNIPQKISKQEKDLSETQAINSYEIRKQMKKGDQK